MKDRWANRGVIAFLFFLIELIILIIACFLLTSSSLIILMFITFGTFLFSIFCSNKYNSYPNDIEGSTDKPIYTTEQEIENAKKETAIGFAEWLNHTTDNGTERYNSKTKVESESKGYSPYDCWIDNTKPIGELYRLYLEEEKTKK